ncbi:MAG: YdeI/OmpD-associated family protein [Bacteroidetes bacterium]|nr:YdeI/OmpD-associated family protein [Bacteroidota bacterium]MBS1934438.1 YdeI/OmpD-associated family protein [Bacteroidota bacterium]
MSQTLLEKLQLKDEKNILIQGLPSSIEKQFLKLTFSKNVTPLLKSRKIDFALVFAVNETQLSNIINEVLPALHEEGKLWVAYPKLTSKIATTLNRDCSWDCITRSDFESVRQVALDHVWTAMRFKKRDQIQHLTRASANGGVPAHVEGVNYETRAVLPPSDFMKELNRSKIASHFFDKLSFTNKKEYVTWVTSAKKEETRSRRLEVAIDKLIAGKKNPSEK